MSDPKQARTNPEDAKHFEELALLCANCPDLKMSQRVLTNVNNLRAALESLREKVKELEESDAQWIKEITITNNENIRLKAELERAKEELIRAKTCLAAIAETAREEYER